VVDAVAPDVQATINTITLTYQAIGESLMSIVICMQCPAVEPPFDAVTLKVQSTIDSIPLSVKPASILVRRWAPSLIPAAIKGLALSIQPLINACTPSIQPGIDAITHSVQSVFKTITHCIQMCGPLIVPHISGSGRLCIKTIVDVFSLLIQMGIYAISAIVESCLDAVAPRIQTILNAISKITGLCHQWNAAKYQG